MRTHTHRWLKRLAAVFSTFVAVFFMSSCTASFCSNQDQANQMYANLGNIYSSGVDVSDPTATDNTEKQNTNRETLYNTLLANGFSLPTKAFNAFMDAKADAFVEENATLWVDGTLGEWEANQAEEIALHVAVYAGLETTEDGRLAVAPLWTNYNNWYQEALDDPAIGVALAPSQSFVSVFQSQAQSLIAGTTACISPSDGVFEQNGATIYVSGKSWGEAFRDYGFLEGLLVYPFAYLIHIISNGLGKTGAAQFLAILVVTLIARIITVLSTFLQSKTQAKQQKIQPMLNALQAKYPNAATDKEQKQALAMEQATLMRKAKVHPFLPLLLLIVQFPIFICVWSALQGSAALASGSFMGLALTTTVSQCFTNFAGTPGAITGIMIFLFMAIANILSSSTSLLFTSWRTKNFGNQTLPTAGSQGMNPNKTMKTFSIVMMVFILIMGFSLPAAMGIYWILGSLISILQALLTEALQTRARHKLARETGDGTTLAAIRRSVHHQPGGKKADKKDKKSKSDKPLWR